MNLLTNKIPSSSPNNNNGEHHNPTTEDCSNCGSLDGWHLHYVRLRGMHRRLCTSCVLRLHPASFCPYCFTFYDSNPPLPSSSYLSCSNCSSFSHSRCAPSSCCFPFLCPPCADPNFTFFRLNAQRLIDQRMASALLCASKIASASMAKAVVVAKAEAEKKVREAALSKKRAREALEHVESVFNKEKDKVNKDEMVKSVQPSGSENLGRTNGVVIALPKFLGHLDSTKTRKNNGNGCENLRPLGSSHVERRPILENSLKEEVINSVVRNSS